MFIKYRISVAVLIVLTLVTCDQEKVLVPYLDCFTGLKPSATPVLAGRCADFFASTQYDSTHRLSIHASKNSFHLSTLCHTYSLTEDYGYSFEVSLEELLEGKFHAQCSDDYIPSKVEHYSPIKGTITLALAKFRHLRTYQTEFSLLAHIEGAEFQNYAKTKTILLSDYYLSYTNDPDLQLELTDASDRVDFSVPKRLNAEEFKSLINQKIGENEFEDRYIGVEAFFLVSRSGEISDLNVVFGNRILKEILEKEIHNLRYTPRASYEMPDEYQDYITITKDLITGEIEMY
jgi:hypothetical protein